jgi:hypothetical protein
VTAYSFDYSNGQTPTTSKKLFPIKIHLIANQTVKLTESTRLHKLNDMIVSIWAFLGIVCHNPCEDYKPTFF